MEAFEGERGRGSAREGGKAGRREGGLTGQKRAIESSKKRPRKMGRRERMDGILGAGGEGREGGRERGKRAEGDLARGKGGRMRWLTRSGKPPSFWIAKMRPCCEGALSFTLYSPHPPRCTSMSIGTLPTRPRSTHVHCLPLQPPRETLNIINTFCTPGRRPRP